MLFNTSNKVRQIIGRTLVCVSIHLECWLDKLRVEIATWAAVGVARKQQFRYNSVSKFWQCERDRSCGFNSHSMRIRGGMEKQETENGNGRRKRKAETERVTCATNNTIASLTNNTIASLYNDSGNVNQRQNESRVQPITPLHHCTMID